MRPDPELHPRRDHGSWPSHEQRLLGFLLSFRYTPITSDQFEAVARATRPAMVGHAINTTIAVVAFAGVAATAELFIWAAFSYAICGYVFWRRQRAPKTAQPAGQLRNGQRAERRAILFGVLLALPWAYLAVRYLGDFGQPAETILISLGVGMAASGAVLLAPIERAAIVYMTTILAATMFKCFFVLGTAQYALLGALGVSFWLFLLALIATTSQLFRNKTQAVERLQIALAETSNAREQIERIAMHDPLTDLANRRAFLQRLARTIERSNISGSHDWAVFFLDLDRFKIVNDTLGHKFGDELLKLVAERLCHCVRPTDLVARLGGDEFSIIAEAVPDASYAEAIAMRLLSEISMPFVIQDHNVTIGASIGVATPDAGHLDSERMLKRADLAMYEAKSSGRNGFKIFEISMQERMDARRLIEGGLKEAIANREFELYFQPIYDLKSMKVARF
jgi:diguanylate cyclase (GGDEF)-like protein